MVSSISMYRTVSLSSHLSFLGQVTHLSLTVTCLRQTSVGPHRSIRWQFRHPCGCSEINKSKIPFLRETNSSVLVSTLIPSDIGVVHEAGLPGSGR